MLAKPYRFTLALEFRKLKKEGRLINGELFGILVKRRGGQLSSRFGFVVSKLVDKRAVARHRIRRRLAEAVRLNLARIKPGNDLVFLTKKTIIGKTFKEVEAEVLRMCLVNLNR